MNRCMTKLATLSALAVGVIMIAGRAEAGAVPAFSGLRPAIDTTALTDNVQYYWGGRAHCWYDDGWRGPGWYWCGYRARRGLGWGGPQGWRGWSYYGDRPRGDGWAGGGR